MTIYYHLAANYTVFPNFMAPLTDSQAFSLCVSNPYPNSTYGLYLLFR